MTRITFADTVDVGRQTTLQGYLYFKVFNHTPVYQNLSSRNHWDFWVLAAFTHYDCYTHAQLKLSKILATCQQFLIQKFKVIPSVQFGLLHYRALT